MTEDEPDRNDQKAGEAAAICHLCGEALEGKITREHVPPRQFFPKSLRGGARLLTVPTHRECNESYSKDEQYVVHSLGPLAFGKPVGEELRKDLRRSYWREDGSGARLYFKVHREFQSRRGSLFLPPDLVAKNYDGRRVRRVMWKIVRGLFYHHRRRYLSAHTTHASALYGRPEDARARFEWALDLPLKIRGDHPDCFAYRFHHHHEEEVSFHYWDMRFWHSVLCILSFHDPACGCEKCEGARSAAGDNESDGRV